MNILIVEDEKKLADAVQYILRKDQHDVDMAYDGITGQEMAETGVYDVIILDKMLPLRDGFAVLKNLRKSGVNSATIILTAAGTISDKVLGLDIGADDYMIKPFANEELLARVRALGRRKSNLICTNDEVAIKDVLFKLNNYEIITANKTIKLTSKEAKVLEFLLINRGIVLTKDQIIQRVWGFNSEIDRNNIEVYMSYLRKKIKEVGHAVTILTVRGIGYSLKEV
ncbi:MAG TPA: DNA-binding response regulator [Clostridiales bacterium]|nr:MAG: DNA-binding response regulator [Clostridiales bacterium GWD2_32_19]HCC07318.1 DNA-binding response regulator [Clostridiales bacterium]